MEEPPDRYALFLPVLADGLVAALLVMLLLLLQLILGGVDSNALLPAQAMELAFQSSIEGSSRLGGNEPLTHRPASSSLALTLLLLLLRPGNARGVPWRDGRQELVHWLGVGGLDSAWLRLGDAHPDPDSRLGGADLNPDCLAPR